MKLYFLTLCLLLNNQAAFSQIERTPEKKKTSMLDYPAIHLSDELALRIFHNAKQKVLNCPILMSSQLNYPSGTAISLCDNAQLACLRYGFLITEIGKAKGKYHEDLNKTLVLEKQEVLVRLRGCELALKNTSSGGESIESMTRYSATGSWGSTKQ